MTKNNHTVACVVDTETSWKNGNPRYVYHFGATFGDLEQSDSFEVFTMDYYPKEVIKQLKYFLHQEKIEGKFKEKQGYTYNKSMERALQDAIDNPHKVKTWREIMIEFNTMCKTMGVDYLASYNFQFDIGTTSEKGGVIRHTHSQLTDDVWYMPRNVDILCIMDIASTLYMNRDYLNYVDNLPIELKEQVMTEGGNYSYSAECVQRYRTKDFSYVESHTALRDSKLEFGLLSLFWGKWKNIIKKEFVNYIKPIHHSYIKRGMTAKDKRQIRLGNKDVLKKYPTQKELKLIGGKNG